MSANLIIGSSHALNFSEAVGAFKATWQEASADLIPIQAASGNPAFLLFATNRPNFLQLDKAAGGEIVGTFGPLMNKVRAFNREDATVVLNIGGNEHNIRFLQADAKPFDFYHPVRPALDASRQIVPEREVRATMTGLLQRTLTVTRMIAAELPAARRYYLPPPPPIPSDVHLRSNSESFDFDAHDVENAGVRLKLYSVYLEIARRFCENQGIAFLPPVSRNRDSEGFLLEPYWNGATHASADYYRPLVSELGL